MKKAHLFLFLFFVFNAVSISFAQTYVGMVAGLPVSCVDATGAPVVTIAQPGVGDVARSKIEPNGARLIVVDSVAFFSLPPLMQLFFYSHECGHHVSGDIVAGIVFRHVNPMIEMNADRIGIRFLRDQLNITLPQAQMIASYFVNNPPVPPYYLPGPQRAKWIIDCYGSEDDACGNSTAQYGQTPSDDASSPDDSSSSDESSSSNSNKSSQVSEDDSDQNDSQADEPQQSDAEQNDSDSQATSTPD